MQNTLITYFWETPCKPSQHWHPLDTKVRHKVPEGRAEGTAAATESHRSEGVRTSVPGNGVTSQEQIQKVGMSWTLTNLRVPVAKASLVPEASVFS